MRNPYFHFGRQLRSGTGHSPYEGELTLPANCGPSGTVEIALPNGSFQLYSGR